MSDTPVSLVKIHPQQRTFLCLTASTCLQLPVGHRHSWDQQIGFSCSAFGTYLSVVWILGLPACVAHLTLEDCPLEVFVEVVLHTPEATLCNGNQPQTVRSPCMRSFQQSVTAKIDSLLENKCTFSGADQPLCNEQGTRMNFVTIEASLFEHQRLNTCRTKEGK